MIYTEEKRVFIKSLQMGWEVDTIETGSGPVLATGEPDNIALIKQI